MPVVLIKSAETMAPDAIGPLTAPAKPVSDPPPKIRSLDKGENPDCGVWECTPGKFRRTIPNAEFAHFVKGRCVFHPDGGAPVEIKAGDSVYMPANTHGVWEVFETVRKTWILLP
ncbi:MAG: cupin domain-containing protein [Hyphomicrobiales bacterium]